MLLVNTGAGLAVLLLQRALVAACYTGVVVARVTMVSGEVVEVHVEREGK